MSAERETGGVEVVIHKIPIIGLPELACTTLVNAEGRAFDDEGEPIGGDRKCGRDGYWLIGAAAVCDEHFRGMCSMVDLDYQDVVDEWRSRL